MIFRLVKSRWMPVFEWACRISSVNKFQDIVREDLRSIFFLEFHHRAVTSLDFNICRAGNITATSRNKRISWRVEKYCTPFASREVIGGNVVLGGFVRDAVVLEFYSRTVAPLHFHVSSAMNWQGVVNIENKFLCTKCMVCSCGHVSPRSFTLLLTFSLMFHQLVGRAQFVAYFARQCYNNLAFIWRVSALLTFSGRLIVPSTWLNERLFFFIHFLTSSDGFVNVTVLTFIYLCGWSKYSINIF